MNTFESVKNYMIKDPVTFSPDEDIRRAIEIMLKADISGGPVLDSNGKLIGILSEKDCLRIIMQGLEGKHPSEHGTVADYMSHRVETISEDVDVVDAAYKFIHTYYKRFPVVNEKGELVGQISRRDVLDAVRKIEPQKKIIPSSWRGREPGKYQKDDDV